MSKKEITTPVMLRTILVSGALAMALAIALSMLLAMLLSAETLPEGMMPLLVLPVTLLAVFAAALLAARRVGQQRLLTALGVGAAYLALMLILRGICFRGAWSFAPSIAAGLGALAAGLLSSGKKRRRR